MIKKKFCIIGVDNDYLDFIKRNSSYFLGYFSLKNKKYKSISAKKWLGDHDKENWIKIKKKYNPTVFFAIDDGQVREKLFNNIYKINCKNILFKNSSISKSSKIFLKKSKSIIIQDYARIMPNVQIGTGSKIHISAQIHHDCKIEKFVTIAPKALILGNVKINEYAYIGANATIKQKIKIGKGAIIGAGAVVTKNVKNFDIVAGVPAKSIKT